MKEIKAIIRREKAQIVLDKLADSGADNVTLTHILATGTYPDNSNSQMNIEFGRNLVTMIKLELICSDSDDLKFIKLIRDSAYTDNPGDGIISSRNVCRLLKIRTNTESIDAL